MGSPPRSRKRRASRWPLPRPEATIDPPAAQGRAMPRILVVEDSLTQAEELRLILESEGLAVQTARDGPTALELLRAGAFDLVLSDIVMPGLSGYDLCRAIKTDPAL